MYCKYDISFIKSLISLVNNNDYKDILDKRLTFLNSRNRLVEISSSTGSQNASFSKDPQNAWMYLSWLNAGYVTRLLPMGTVRTIIDEASNLPLSQSYPIFSLAIENIVQSNNKLPHVKTYIWPVYDALLLGTEFIGSLTIRSLEQLKRTRSYASVINNSSDTLIRPDRSGSNAERNKALNTLKDWFTQEVEDYLIICDQFFGINDLDILFILSSLKPDCKVWILTSKKQQEKVSQPWSETYYTYWHDHISPIQDPPDTDIIVVGTRDGKSPIHDRWWISKSSGLHLGTSYNGLGKSLSDMRHLDADQTRQKEIEIQQYLMKFKKEYQGERLSYDSILLKSYS